MEITLDAGKNVIQSINEIANKEKTEFELVALKMLDLGIRVYQSSNVDEKELDPLLSEVFNLSLVNNFMIKEIMGHVFLKERSAIRAYDAPSAISCAENMLKSFNQGKSSI